MARRRMAEFAQMYLQNMLRQRQIEQQYELQGKNQAALADLQGKNQTAQQDIDTDQQLLGFLKGDPQLAARLQRIRPQVAGVDVGAFIPSEEEAVGGAAGELAKVTDLKALPTDVDLEMSNRGRAGFPQKDPRPIEELMAQRNARGSAIRGGAPLVQQARVAPGGRNMEQSFVNPYEAQEPVATTFTPEQAGQNDADAALTKLRGTEGNAEWGQIQADYANKLEALTRGEKAKTSFATSNANARGQMTPDLIDARTRQAGGIAGAQAGAQRAAGIGTQGERNAAAVIVPLLQSEAKATELEGRGTYLQTGAQTAASNPMIGSLLKNTGMFSPDTMEYTNAMTNIASTVTYLRSGVTSRDDEFQRYMGMLSVMPTDVGNANAVKMKQNTRKMFLRAAQVSMGRSKTEGGIVLGEAVRTGQIPEAFLETLNMDPEFAAGVVSALNQGAR